LRARLQSLSYDKGGQNPQKLFQHYDTDNSGALDYGEFTRAIRKGGKVTKQWMSDTELGKLFNLIDADRDGTISIEQLTRFIWGGASAQRKGLRAATRSTSPGNDMEVLYDQFEQTLSVDDDHPSLLASDRSPKSALVAASSPQRLWRPGAAAEAETMSGWGSGDQSADEEQIMAAFEEGLALNSAKRSPRIRPTPARRHGSQSRRASSRQSLRIRSLVSPPRRRREAAYYEGAAHALVSPPRVRPYFDSALPYFSTPVAKLASQAAIDRLSSPRWGASRP